MCIREKLISFSENFVYVLNGWCLMEEQSIVHSLPFELQTQPKSCKILLFKKMCGWPPLPFFENRKKCPDFGKKGHDCIHSWIKFSIQNVVLSVSRRKNSKVFPCGAFFSRHFDEMFIEVPNPTKPPTTWKIFGCT